MMKTMTRIFILGFAFALAACSNTMTGVGKDLQEMGKKMDPQAKPPETAPAPNSSSSTTNKDVTVTPVK